MASGGISLEFAGENRKADRARLWRLYDDVAGAAQALQPGSTPDAPIHRVALIQAERGLGKTRLALELYRYLTTRGESADYWPDDFDGLGEASEVRPDAKNCNFDHAPHFVWWGLKVPAGKNSCNAVHEARHELIPHLTMARAGARTRQSGRSIAAELADVGVEFGLGLGEEALHAAGFGLAKKVGEVIWKIGRIVSGHSKMANPQFEQTSVSDAILDDLTTAFAPHSPHFVGCPLVIFIDDAQYADRDVALPAFLERLIARSAVERWPLLLVIIHWARELRPHVDADGNQVPKSAVAEVLHHAIHRRDSDKGRFARRPGGRLSAEHYATIDLSKPVDDLEPTLDALFPGLSGENRAMILARVDGNPRLL